MKVDRTATSQRQSGDNNSNRYKLDRTDREIVRQLQRDGRRQYGAIAREMGVSDNTVRNRVTQMQDAGVFRVAAMVDPIELGYDGYAMLLIKPAQGTDPEALGEHFCALPNVTFAALTASQYAVLVEVVFKHQHELTGFLKQHCYTSAEVFSVEPLVGLKIFKNTVAWAIPD